MCGKVSTPIAWTVSIFQHPLPEVYLIIDKTEIIGKFQEIGTHI